VRRFDSGERGVFILKALAVVLVVLVLGLLLDGLGLGLGAYVVLAALLVGVIVIYVLPLLPSRR
jgi:hypothetical protein